MAKVGAKGKYAEWLTPDGLILLSGWARDGLTDEQIAHNMGINRTTLYDWKSKYEDIDNALKKTKVIVDMEVENALLKRALGYFVEEEKVIESEKDGKRVEKTRKHIPADVTAQIYWLKNRKKEAWRDKQEQEVTVIGDDTRVQVQNLINARVNKRDSDRHSDE